MSADPDQRIGTNKSGRRAAMVRDRRDAKADAATRALDFFVAGDDHRPVKAAAALVYAAELFIAAYSAGLAAGKIDLASLALAYERTLAAYRFAKENDR